MLGLALILSLVAAGSGDVVELNEENWTDILQGEWMVKFYAPWCPACRSIKGTWEEFGKWDKDLGIDGVGQVDVTQTPGLSGRFLITSLPTIFHVKDGEFRQYTGSRTRDGFIDHIEAAKWKNDERMPDWKHPNSVLMSVVAWFYQISMHLKNAHALLTETYQLPSWSVYAIFAILTIITGAVLGLMLVVCIDCVLPFLLNRTTRLEPLPELPKKPKSKESDGEDNEEEVEDDAPQSDGDAGSVRARRRRPEKT